MTAQNKTTLKGYFNTGDQPTEAQFADLIDTLGLLRQSNNALQADEAGNTRGAKAIDLQQSRAADTQVASGDDSLVSGKNCTASGAQAQAHGYGTEATGIATQAQGLYSKAELRGEQAFAAGKFSNNGDAQSRRFCLRRTGSHTDGTWYSLDLSTGVERLSIPSDTLWQFQIMLVGLSSGAPQQWSYKIEGAIVNDGGTVTLLESVVTTRHESDAAYETQVVADNANDALLVQVRRNGGTSYYLRWVATVNIVQVSY